jgi:hypothetical protein
LPELLVESLEAAVEVVRGVIRGERVFASIEQEFRPADASRDTANEGSKKRMRAKISLEIIEPQHDIDFGLIRAHYPNRCDDAAIVRYVARESASI